MDKAPDAFRTISEVAEDLDLPQHVLRFWETRFSQIKPMKRGGGRRYYRPDDVELLRGIRHLLYGEGYTIKGVQRILKEQGVRFVMEIWRNPGMPIPTERMADSGDEGEDFDPAEEAETLPRMDLRTDAQSAGLAAPRSGAGTGFGGQPQGLQPRFTAPHPEPAQSADLPAFVAQPVSGTLVGPQRPTDPDPLTDDPLPAGILPEGAPARGGFRLMSRLRGVAQDATGIGSTPAGLSREDIRRLQSTLFELLECKRLLDQSR